MNAQTAQIVLYAITLVAVVVWLAGLMFLDATVRGLRAAPPERFEAAESPTAGRLVGAVEVEGRPEDLLARASKLLATGNVAPLGSVRIVERTPRTIQFQGVREFGRRGAGQFLREGRIELSHSPSGGTRAVYAVDLRYGRGLLLAGAICQLAGLAAIVLGFWAIRTYVVPSANPAVRTQAVQMVQVIHLLWPPFMLIGLARRSRSVVRGTLEAFLANLPYVEERS